MGGRLAARSAAISLRQIAGVDTEARIGERAGPGMHVGRCGARIAVWAPAKLNLFLEVRDRRGDGYHDIETLMTAIDIFDTLYFVADRVDQIRFQATWVIGRHSCATDGPEPGGGADRDEVPEGRENLVVRAVELVRQRAGVKMGARMRLLKRIPMQAGLGGASSDAAAALVAANLGWELGWPRGKLQSLAAELGSDIPFFLGSGTAVCRGRGEQVESVAGLGRMDFVVAQPPGGLSTARVYQQCRPAVDPRSVSPLVEDARARGPAAVGQGLWNRLRPAASHLAPSIEHLGQQFQRLDLLGHQMSGSGSSLFGVCRHARQARRAAELLRARRVGHVYHAATVGASRAILTHER